MTGVAIVAAGIGGLAGALPLRRCDVEVGVLEQADHLQPVGRELC
jgi:2-polyprenyl-6-methoxyphenol hydroxylase-like FAD-dependent oxidoreductase